MPVSVKIAIALVVRALLPIVVGDRHETTNDWKTTGGEGV
jgi:hypothetical protein